MTYLLRLTGAVLKILKSLRKIRKSLEELMGRWKYPKDFTCFSPKSRSLLKIFKSLTKIYESFLKDSRIFNTSSVTRSIELDMGFAFNIFYKQYI